MSRRSAISVVLVSLAVAGCDDDPPPPPPPVSGKPPASVSGAAAATSKNALVEKPHVEDRVACPIPDQPSDPKNGKCDIKAPSCTEHMYCLSLAQGDFCEPCAERDGIRHAFRDRDFDGEHNRDPFESVTNSAKPTTTTLTPKCPHSDQMIATGYSWSDLKLVGIVSQGTQRKVLMMGGPLGYIIKRNDCVGKEKALVKEIGLGYVTFQLENDEYSIQLNPKQLAMAEPDPSAPPPSAPRTTITPVVAPPPTRGAPAAGQAPAPAAPAPAGTAPAAVPAGTVPAGTAPAAAPAGAIPAGAAAAPAAPAAKPAPVPGAPIRR